MKRLQYIALSILYLCIVVAVYDLLPMNESGMKVMGILGIMQLILSVFSWARLTGSILVPYVVFLVAAYIFTYGQSMLYVFDRVTPERDLSDMFLVSSIMPAQYLTLIFLNCFNIGAMLSCRPGTRHNVQRLESDNVNTSNQIRGIRAIGLLFLGISVIPYIVERVSTFVLVSNFGYAGIYMQEARVGIFNIINILSQYYVPGVLCLICVARTKRQRNVCLALLVIEALFWLFIGGRSNGVIIAAIILMYYHICVRPIKIRQALLVGVAAFFFISALGVISEIRSDPDADFAEALSNGFSDNNAFFSAISEMGSSMYPMIATMEVVPEAYDFKYGSSYLYALSSIVPNFGFWDLHPAMKYGNMNDWLQRVMNLSYGPGFSIVAEAYVNFGRFGFMMMLLLGYMFASILNVNIRDRRNPLLLVLAFVLSFLIIKTVRNSFLATVRSVFYYILPIYVAVVYFYKGRIIK